MRFNIVLVEPPEFKHVAVFHDLARLLGVSLQSLGHSVMVQTNVTDAGASNLILGYHAIAPPSGIQWIPYQLEQLSQDNERMDPRWLQVLQQAPQIWDYDPLNIAYLHSHGIRTAKLVPIGFHPAMRTIAPRTADIDILHYGSMSDRRRRILDAMAKHCRVEHAFGAYGAARDELIARSKIVLNIHLYESAIFEQVRVSYLLNNARCVVSEESRGNPFAEMVTSAPYDQLVDRCLRLLADDSERQRVAAEGAKRFEAFHMPHILARAIDEPCVE